jgi:FSR family fosmidomycin resistance protein-like MFS transporter
MNKRGIASIIGARWLRGAFPLTLLFLLIEFFDELHYGVQGAALPYIRNDLGLTYAQAGLLLGLPGLLGSFFEPVIMLFGDTSLRKSLIILGGSSLVGVVILLGTAQTFPIALIAMTISFLASGAFVTLSQATLMDLNPNRQPQMMARWTLAGSIGNLAGPLLVAAVFTQGLSWRVNYLILAVPAFALTLLLLVSKFPPRPQRLTDDAQPHESETPLSLLSGLWQAVRNIHLMRWLVLLDFADLLLDVFLSYSALYFSDVVGLASAQVAVTMSAMMAAGLLSNIALIPILEKVDGRRLVRVTALISGVGYAAWLLAPWVWAKIGLALAVRLSTLGWYEVLQGEAYAALPGRSGTVMALNSITGLLGGVLIWSVGWLAEQTGLQTAMWLLLAGPLSLIFFAPARRVSAPGL